MLRRGNAASSPNRTAARGVRLQVLGDAPTDLHGSRLDWRCALALKTRETPDRRPEEAIKAKRTHSKGALQRYWKRGSNRISWTLLSSPPYLCLRCCLQELNNAAKTSQPRSAHHLTPHMTTPDPRHARLPRLNTYYKAYFIKVIKVYVLDPILHMHVSY